MTYNVFGGTLSLTQSIRPLSVFAFHNSLPTQSLQVIVHFHVLRYDEQSNIVRVF